MSWPTLTSPISKTSSFKIDDCTQPTESGKLESGKFGFVRENGTRFHEGIDIKSFSKGKDNTPTDTVHAFMDGKVIYINTSGGGSSYGRYIVVEHQYFLTLYAHLAEIYPDIGKTVKAGEKIGLLGTTSNCSKIPNERAHVHFEIDFQIGDTDTFGRWYGDTFKDKNTHGAHNGLNLIGIDPLVHIQKMIHGTKLTDLLIDEQEAITIQIVTAYVPWFVKKYASLVAKGVDLAKPIKGWEIEFTWFGLPKKWTPIYTIDQKAPQLKLISYRKSLKTNAILREVLKEEKTNFIIGTRIINVLKKISFNLK
jgi:murein DD-endopeptidase MepM/ murein hydrolase activator NlpD